MWLTAASTYVASYAMFFANGHGPAEFMELQWEMASFSAMRPTLISRPMLPPAFMWLLGLETIYVTAQYDPYEAMARYLLKSYSSFAILPMAWLSIFPVAYQFYRTRAAADLFILTYLSSSWLPLLPLASVVNWYLLIAMPAFVILIARFLQIVCLGSGNKPLIALLILIYLLLAAADTIATYLRLYPFY